MKPTISIFGNFQNGKSTLVNCLLESDMAKVGGVGLSVTKINTRYAYGAKLSYALRGEDGTENIIVDEQDLDSIGCNKELVVYLPNRILQFFDLVDTPGYNASEQDTTVADSLIRHTDFAILLIHNKGLSEDEKRIAKKLSSFNIPFIVIMNCYNDIFDNWNPMDKCNSAISDNVLSELNYNNSTLLPNGLFVTNLIWYWLSLDASKDSILSNKSIARSSKLLNNYWENFTSEPYSQHAVAEISQFLKLLDFLCSLKFCHYIQGLKIVNDALSKMKSIIEIHVSKQENFLNNRLTEMQKEYRNSHDCLKKKLLDEIKQIEESQAEVERKQDSSNSILKSLFYLAKHFVLNLLDTTEIKKAEITKSEVETEDIIQFLESIKTK